MALTTIEMVRLNVGDNSVELPILTDEEYQYLLDKNNNSINLSSLDAARIILMKLSVNANNYSVDIFSVSGAKAAEQYREALKLYLKNPDLNPMLNTAVPYMGGLSKLDMETNNANSDTVTAPTVNPMGSTVGTFFDA